MSRRLFALCLLLLGFSLPVMAQQPVTAYVELRTALDAKTVKPNEAVSATLRQGIKLADGTKLSEGTFITGKVVSVDNAGAPSITVLFNEAKLSDGTSLPLQILIRRIQEPAAGGDADEDNHDIKIDGAPVSKLRGVSLASGDGVSGSGTFSGKGNLRIEYKTLLGCVVTGKAA